MCVTLCCVQVYCGSLGSKLSGPRLLNIQCDHALVYIPLPKTQYICIVLSALMNTAYTYVSTCVLNSAGRRMETVQCVYNIGNACIVCDFTTAVYALSLLPRSPSGHGSSPSRDVPSSRPPDWTHAQSTRSGTPYSVYSFHCILFVVNPRRACAARVTVVVLCVCVCVCVQAAYLRLTQLSDKLDILTDLVSWWLQNEFGVFRIMASFRR